VEVAVSGWFKKRIRKENLKLVKQNQLAALYIKSFSETSSELGQAESQDLFGLMFGGVTQADSLLTTLAPSEALSQNEFDEQFRINKNLRLTCSPEKSSIWGWLSHPA